MNTLSLSKVLLAVSAPRRQCSSACLTCSRIIADIVIADWIVEVIAPPTGSIFLIFLKIYIILNYVCICGFVCLSTSVGRGIASPGNGITGCCELSDMGAGK